FQLDVDVEVVLDRVLAAPGDEDDVVDPGGERFLDAVLNGRLVDERQHLLGLSLGGGQKPGPETRGREDGFAHGGRHARELSTGESRARRRRRSATATIGAWSIL